MNTKEKEKKYCSVDCHHIFNMATLSEGDGRSRISLSGTGLLGSSALELWGD